MNRKIKSELSSLEKLTNANNKFIVPIYQRLYVWKDENINKFMEDIYNSYKQGKKYYIGNVLFLENINNKNEYHIIDGQQRFTTLFIISKAISDNKINIDEFDYAFYINGNKEYRLQFEARKYANNYFNNSIDDANNIDDDMNTLKNSLAIIKNFEAFKEEKEISKFIEFIVKNVEFSLTIIPNDNRDINKLFEVMNSTSVQLEQHQILKAKLLSKIKEKENENKNEKYSVCADIWDLVSDINKALNKKLLKKILNELKKLNEHKDIDSIYNLLYEPYEIKENQENKESQENQEQEDVQTFDNKYENLFDKLETPKETEQTEETNNNNNDIDLDNNDCRKSIINFNYFLLHTLRIFYIKNKKEDLLKEDLLKKLTIDDKKLINIFNTTLLSKEKEEDENIFKKNIINFFILMLKLRMLFDNHIIVWADKNLVIDNDDYNDNQMIVLQTLLYHSQSEKRYWLTPLLYMILEIYEKKIENIIDKNNKTINREFLFNYLLQLEHILYFTDYKDNETESYKTIKISIESIEETLEIKKTLNDKFTKLLSEKNLGTKFDRYIFYKLDFILYYCLINYNNIKDFLISNEYNQIEFNNDNNKIEFNIENLEKCYSNVLKIKESIKNYRIMSRNSIEHIIPMIDPNNEDITEEDKNSFGNLTLISVSDNSSFTNNKFKDKQGLFIEKKLKDNKKLDSIKALIIYANTKFDKNDIEKHKKDMIKIIKNYCDYIKEIKF